MGRKRGPDSKGPPPGQTPDRDRPGRGEAAVSAQDLAEMVGQVGQVKADHAPAAGWIWYDGSAPGPPWQGDPGREALRRFLAEAFRLVG